MQRGQNTEIRKYRGAPPAANTHIYAITARVNTGVIVRYYYIIWALILASRDPGKRCHPCSTSQARSPVCPVGEHEKLLSWQAREYVPCTARAWEPLDMRLPADTGSSWDGSSVCVFAPRQRHCCPLTRLLNLTWQPVCDVVLHTAGPEALRPRWRPSPSCGMQQVPPSQIGDVPQKGSLQRSRPVTKLSCTRLRGMFPGRPLITLSVATLITLFKH